MSHNHFCKVDRTTMPRSVPYDEFCARHDNTLNVIFQHILSFLENEFDIDTNVETDIVNRTWGLVTAYVYNTSTSKNARSAMYF